MSNWPHSGQRVGTSQRSRLWESVGVGLVCMGGWTWGRREHHRWDLYWAGQKVFGFFL